MDEVERHLPPARRRPSSHTDTLVDTLGRVVGLLLAYGCALAALGCATPHARPPLRLEDARECRVEDPMFAERLDRARRTALDWLELTPLKLDTREQPPDPPRLVASHPDLDGRAGARSYLYDNALALLWLTWTDRIEAASDVARALLALQREDGGWAFSFRPTKGRSTHPVRIRNGAVAWATHGLAYFARRRERPAMQKAARRAASYLLASRYGPEAGRARGLIGRRRGQTSPRLAVTEHQLDAYMALRHLEPSAGRDLESRILEVLWMPEPGRFALALVDDRLDERRALDAAGAWGALWLHQVGRDRWARRSLEYVRRHFPVEARGLSGYRPYLDAVDGYDVERGEAHVFVEGSLGVGLAAHRLGQPNVAREMLTSAVEMQCLAGPGVPYSNLDVADFPASPAAAPTLWFLFLQREWRTDRRAPIFASPEEDAPGGVP